MLSSLLGNIDWPSAVIMVAAFAAASVLGSIALARPSARKQQLDHSLAVAQMQSSAESVKLQKQQEHEMRLAQIASNREIEFKRIDSGMIDVKAARSQQED